MGARGRTIGALIAATLAVAPVAAAQESCEQLQSIVGTAGEHFKPFWRQEVEQDVYSADPLKGAEWCEVLDVVDTTFVCIWSFPTAEQATRDFDERRKLIASCLGGWRRDGFDGENWERTIGSDHIVVGVASATRTPTMHFSYDPRFDHVVSFQIMRWND